MAAVVMERLLITTTIVLDCRPIPPAASTLYRSAPGKRGGRSRLVLVVAAIAADRRFAGPGGKRRAGERAARALEIGSPVLARRPGRPIPAWGLGLAARGRRLRLAPAGARLP